MVNYRREERRCLWYENIRNIFYMYVEILCSLSLTRSERVQYAYTVVNVLKIWRSWIHHSPDLHLNENFITCQCYTDVILSCHKAVLHIKAPRMFSPKPIVLLKIGSECCKDYFSYNNVGNE